MVGLIVIVVALLLAFLLPTAFMVGGLAAVLFILWLLVKCLDRAASTEDTPQPPAVTPVSPPQGRDDGSKDEHPPR